MRDSRKIQPILSALPAFEEAARVSSFSLAAQSLGMAQPSVSRFVAILENQIGVKLFVRQHNRVMLTEEGERLYEATTLGLGHIRSVLDELSDKSTSKTVTISCTHGFAHMWILPRMDELKARLGNQEVRILTADHSDQAAIDGDHVAVRLGDGKWQDGKSLLLFTEEVYPVCSPGLAAQHNLLGQKLTAGDFAELPLIVQDNGEYGWLSWSGWFDFFDASFEHPTALQMINNYAFVLQSAMEGRGIALAWHNLIEPYLSNGWLTKLSNFSVTTDNGYYLVLPHNHPIEDAAPGMDC